MKVFSRGYARATPGRPTLLISDFETGNLTVEAELTERTDAPLEVWTPTTAETHDVQVDGIENLTAHDVPGGRILTAVPAVPGAYSLRVVAR